MRRFLAKNSKSSLSSNLFGSSKLWASAFQLKSAFSSLNSSRFSFRSSSSPSLLQKQRSLFVRYSSTSTEQHSVQEEKTEQNESAYVLCSFFLFYVVFTFPTSLDSDFHPIVWAGWHTLTGAFVAFSAPYVLSFGRSFSLLSFLFLISVLR
jgi:hypothetical protein